MAPAWFLRKVAHVWPDCRRALGICFWMVRLLTVMPSFSSSPRMRSAPQSRFSWAKRLMSAIVTGGDAWLQLFLLRLAAPIQAKQVPMPTQQSVGLDNVQGLLPEPGAASQKNETRAVGRGQLWPLDLTPEDDELVPQ